MLQRRDILAGVPVSLLAGGCALPTPETTQSTDERLWTDQPAFSIVCVSIHDGKAFGQYVAGHTPSIAAAGGRFLVAGSLPTAIEGEWPARRMVMHQWPRPKSFLDWYDSAAYAPWKRLRHSASSADVVLMQGVAAADLEPVNNPAFVVIDVNVHDGAAFGRYVQGHMPGLRAEGGAFLAAGGRLKVIEGSWAPRRLVLQRWPSTADFRRWYESAEYRPWREQRWRAASTRVALVEGLSAAARKERRLP